jgi:hypothetical protein
MAAVQGMAVAALDMPSDPFPLLAALPRFRITSAPEAREASPLQMAQMVDQPLCNSLPAVAALN